MKLKNKTLTTIIAPYIALCLMLPANSMGLILCVGDDGHTALSLNINKQCCASAEQESKNTDDQHFIESLAAQECSPCIDIPFSGDSYKRNVQTYQHINSLHQAVQAGLFSSLNTDREHAGRFTGRHLFLPPNNFVRESVRTVVLII